MMTKQRQTPERTEQAEIVKLLQQQATRSKYRNVKTTVDGIVFDSKKEAHRYAELLWLVELKRIFRLQVQPKYRLCAFRPEWRTETEPTLIGHYVADFRYCHTAHCGCAWGCVVEDVKGVKTALYKWKKKHFEAQYKIKIVEV